MRTEKVEDFIVLSQLKVRVTFGLIMKILPLGTPTLRQLISSVSLLPKPAQNGLQSEGNTAFISWKCEKQGKESAINYITVNEKNYLKIFFKKTLTLRGKTDIQSKQHKRDTFKDSFPMVIAAFCIKGPTVQRWSDDRKKRNANIRDRKLP